MQNCIHIFYSVLISSLVISVNAYAVPTDSTGTNSVTVTPKVETINFGSTSTVNYVSPTDSQSGAVKCSNGQVIIGYAVSGETYSNNSFTENVYYDLSTSNYYNYSVGLLTSTGTRAIFCQTVQLGFY